MNLVNEKFILDDENLEFENFVSTVEIPSTFISGLSVPQNITEQFSNLPSHPMTTLPLVPINIDELIGESDVSNSSVIPSSDTSFLLQYNRSSSTLEETESSSESNIDNSNDTNSNNIEDKIMPQDILRDYNLTLSTKQDALTRSSTLKKVDNIFSYLEENNEDLLNAMAAYRIPHCISKAILKQSILVAINFEDEEL